MNDLLSRVSAATSGFSKSQKLIARFITEHYDKAAFMTASRLGAAIGVSESTVVRFADAMGYDGFPPFQRELQELIRSRLTSYQRIDVSEDRLDKQDVLKATLLSDIDKIKMTLEELKSEDFNACVEMILSAKNIYIIGVRSSAAPANFLGFYFNLIFGNVRLIQTTSVSEMFEQIFRVEQGDVVIGVSFPRYSKQTVKALQFSRDRGASVIAITDSMLSPLVQCADNVLFAKSDMASFVDSLVAPMSVINALIVAVGRRKRGEIYETFQDLERIWDEYDIYEKYGDTL